VGPDAGGGRDEIVFAVTVDIGEDAREELPTVGGVCGKRPMFQAFSASRRGDRRPRAGVEDERCVRREDVCAGVVDRRLDGVRRIRVAAAFATARREEERKATTRPKVSRRRGARSHGR
jgi:hypothetical protein